MSERLNDYFAREASEYLEELEGLLRLPGAPDADSLLRLATGVRGSAQMAQAESVALRAGQLEDTARSLLSGELSYTDSLRAGALETVQELKGTVSAFVRRNFPDPPRPGAGVQQQDDDRNSAPLSAGPSTVPISSLYFDDAGPHIVGPSALPSAPGRDPRATPIGELLLRGDDALQEALALRSTLERFARGDNVPGRGLDDVIVELFELVEQGMSTGTAGS